MKRLVSLTIIVAAITVPAFAAQDEPAPTAGSCTPLRQIYSLKHWHSAHPGQGVNACPANHRRTLALKERYFDYQTYRRVATHRGPGSGPASPADGRWWAIPWYIVCGESGGNFRVNADGAYQIIPSTWRAYGGNQFASTAGEAEPLEQHIVAHRARAGGEPWYGSCS